MTQDERPFIGPAPIATDGMHGIEGVERVVTTIAATAVANEEYFGQLDAVVGDGDFGYSLARGFERIIAGWAEFDRHDAGAFLKKVALAMTGAMGGTSGPIWGTAFLRAGTAASGVKRLDGPTVVAMLRAAVVGITARGHAELGDKTLLDSLVPAIDAIEAAVAQGQDLTATLDAAAGAARSSAEATASLRARRGRASYTGERSVGSVDAGAMAVAVIFEALAADQAARKDH